MNGTPDSIITASLYNWNGQAVKVPRSEIQGYGHDDLSKAGVYFLFCNDDGNNSVYIRTVLKDSEKAVMAEFMDYVKLITATLSCNVFAPVTETKDSRQYSFCKSEKLKAEAKGFACPGGFTVLKGSVISDTVAPSEIHANTKNYALRVKLEEGGIIRDRKFQSDYEFSSPSAASSVVLGFNASGNYYWRTEDGVKLGDIQR